MHALPTLTLCFLLERYCWINFTDLISKSWPLSFAIKRLWCKQPKALERPVIRAPNVPLLSTYFLSNFSIMLTRQCCWEIHIDISEAAHQSRGILINTCSENMQQNYRRTPMPKRDFNKVAKQLYWDRTSVWVFPCKFAAYFQSIFS